MNTKCLMAAGIIMLAAFAGIAVLGDVDAEESGDAPVTTTTTKATVEYRIGTTVVTDALSVEGEVAKVPTTLKDPAALGYSIKAGQTFHGWADAVIAEGVAPATVYSAGSTYSVDAGETVTLYAYITDDVYTVTFAYADGTVISTHGGVKYGQKVTLPAIADAKAEGKVIEFADGECFAGWALKDTAEVVIAADAAEVAATGNASYVAVYVHNPVLTFVVDGTTTYTHTAYGIVTPNAPTKAGFSFVGWSDGETTITDLGAYIAAVKADATLVAVWEPAVYTVHFYAGETEILPAQSVKHGELVTEPKTVPVKEGYDFAGWDHDFSAPVVSDLTINAEFTPTPAPAPTGFDDPTTQVLAICLGTMVLAMIALAIWKREAIRVAMLKRLDKGGKGPGDGQA